MVVASVEDQKQRHDLGQTEVKQGGFRLNSVLWDTQNTIRGHRVQADLNLYPQSPGHRAHGSYRTMGFFLRLSNAAVVPHTVHSRAFESHVVAEERYEDRGIACVDPTEKRDGRIGINLQSVPNET